MNLIEKIEKTKEITNTDETAIYYLNDIFFEMSGGEVIGWLSDRPSGLNDSDKKELSLKLINKEWVSKVDTYGLVHRIDNLMFDLQVYYNLVEEIFYD